MKHLTITLLAFLIISLGAKAQMHNGLKLCIAGKSGGNITIKEFLSDSVVHTCADSIITLKVNSFKISIIAKGKSPVLDISSNSDSIPAKANDLIAQCHAGDKIFIEYVHARLVKGSDTSERALDPVAFTIVDK